jgi:hypothetical protein
MAKTIKVVLDVDGVLLNFQHLFSNFIEEHYGLTSATVNDKSQYTLYHRFPQHIIDGITIPAIKENFEAAGKWAELKAMENSHMIQELLINPLFEIYFVTSISPHLIDFRHKNLCNILDTHIPKETIFCVPLGDSKKPYVDQLCPDYFVEDNLHNLVDCEGKHQSMWIDLEEPDAYEVNEAAKHKVQIFKNFNDVVKTIFSQHNQQLLVN